MTKDPISPRRGPLFHRSWLSNLFGGRSRPRLTSVDDLPPHIRNDIGLREDFVNALRRHHS